MSAVAPSPMPRWDLDVYFPGLDSPEYATAVQEVTRGISGLGDALSKLEGQPSGAQQVAELLAQFGRVLADYRLVEAYVYGKMTENTLDDLAQAKISEIEQVGLPLRQVQTRFDAWIGSQDVEAILAEGGQSLSDYAFLLRRAKIRATHLMTPAEEALANELDLTGASAWSKLHGNVTSRLEVAVELGGATKTMPMSAVRTLAYDPDREVRRAAYEAELAAWPTVETSIAAAMNSIKGQVNALSRRRNWGSALDEAVFANSIDRETLDAMMAAAHEAFPDVRRYMRAKARAIGADRMEWYDLFAPIEGEGREWTVEESCDFVATQFDAFSSKMGDFARRSYRENWTDFEPRKGKVDGAYCMGTRNDESRVLMNFKPSFGSVKTLAHELGHAYHNLCFAHRPPLLRDAPATLAETASIFCETIVKNAALSVASGKEKVSLLEACIQGPCQTVVDITSRFLFEKAVFEDRAARELSASELKEHMLTAQKQTYGDGLASYHPYMWAAKPHYYSTHSFYNFPYMFGLLFSLGLYAVYEGDREGFRDRYDDLLSSTQMGDAHELGQRFGCDTRDVAFWRGSLNDIRRDIDAFDALV